MRDEVIGYHQTEEGKENGKGGGEEKVTVNKAFLLTNFMQLLQ